MPSYSSASPSIRSTLGVIPPRCGASSSGSSISRGGQLATTPAPSPESAGGPPRLRVRTASCLEHRAPLHRGDHSGTQLPGASRNLSPRSSMRSAATAPSVRTHSGRRPQAYREAHCSSRTTPFEATGCRPESSVRLDRPSGILPPGRARDGDCFRRIPPHSEHRLHEIGCGRTHSSQGPYNGATDSRTNGHP